jgi:hypothetical protein
MKIDSPFLQITSMYEILLMSKKLDLVMKQNSEVYIWQT